MEELENVNVDLLSYQQSIGGSIFNYDHATQDDIDFDEPLLERSRQKEDVEIVIPELWEIVAPLPVVEVPSLPHSSDATETSVLPSLPPVPHSSDATEPSVLPSVLS